MSSENRIIKVKKDDAGKVVEVMFENGHLCPINHVIQMAKNGSVEGYNVVRGKDGGEYLSADPNSHASLANLEDLPRFK